VAPLLPKLRGQFAEFLNQNLLDRLGMLYLTTCVGLGYGHPQHSLDAFLGSMASVTRPWGSPSRLDVVRPGFAWSAVYTLGPGQPSPGIT
jgi:hypothetical protein